jgi:hypothetical protein
MKAVHLGRHQPEPEDQIDPSLLDSVEASPDGRAILAVPFSEQELDELETFARRHGTDEISAIRDMVRSVLAARRDQ